MTRNELLPLQALARSGKFKHSGDRSRRAVACAGNHRRGRT